jgi:hypothetical protein
MTAEEFVRQLDGENQRRLSRLAPDDTLKPEVEGDLNVLNLLKVALKNEIEATEIAARSSPPTRSTSSSRWRARSETRPSTIG